MAERRTPLRAVDPDEPPPSPPKLKTLAEAIEGGDYLEILLAQRREIAHDLPDEKGPAKAALHRQLSLISKEIAALEMKDAEDTDGGADVDDAEFDTEVI